MLIKILELKYGLLPSWAQHKIAPADSEAIEQWTTKRLSAQTMNEVFNSEN
ncbi:MAG: hypothetical protein P8179_12525 [Candidatus Thiodiazotropha sp.]